MSKGSLSSDGSEVFFQSRDKLPTVEGTPADASTDTDVYEYESGTLHLISSGAADSAGATLAAVSPSGDDVYFTTADPLAPQDGDSAVDLYDARVDGASRTRR